MASYEYSLYIEAPSKLSAARKVRHIEEDWPQVTITPPHLEIRSAPIIGSNVRVNPDIDIENIGRFIASAVNDRIEELDITPAEAARRSRTSIGRLLNGDNSISIRSLIKISIGLNTPLDNLLKGLVTPSNESTDNDQNENIQIKPGQKIKVRPAIAKRIRDSLARLNKGLRGRSKLSESGLGRQSGVSKTTVSKLLNGQLQQISTDQIIRFAEVLRVTPEYLLAQEPNGSSSEQA